MRSPEPEPERRTLPLTPTLARSQTRLLALALSLTLSKALTRWTVKALVERAGDVVVEVADVPGGGAPPTATKLADFLRGGEESSRAAVSQLFHVWQEPATGFHLPKDSFMDPEMTAIRPDRVLMTLTPNGGGLPMRAGHALVDVLVRGAKTWLLQAPSEATHSRMHPADATAEAPWPYDAETLFSCDQVRVRAELRLRGRPSP